MVFRLKFGQQMIYSGTQVNLSNHVNASYQHRLAKTYSTSQPRGHTEKSVMGSVNGTRKVRAGSVNFWVTRALHGLF